MRDVDPVEAINAVGLVAGNKLITGTETVGAHDFCPSEPGCERASA